MMMANAEKVPNVRNKIRARYRRLFPHVISRERRVVVVHEPSCVSTKRGVGRCGKVLVGSVGALPKGRLRTVARAFVTMLCTHEVRTSVIRVRTINPSLVVPIMQLLNVGTVVARRNPSCSHRG